MGDVRVSVRVCAPVPFWPPRVPAPGSLKASTAILLPFVHFTIRSQGLPQYRCRQPSPPSLRSICPPWTLATVPFYINVRLRQYAPPFPFLPVPLQSIPPQATTRATVSAG